MALVGGGGAGNIAGGNPAGTGSGLNVIGDHCYAHSGKITDAGTGAANATMLNFSTGSYYAVVDLFFITNVNDNRDVFVDLTFDSQSVYKGQWDEAPTARSMGALVRIVIPPYTNVVFKWGCSASKIATAVISGRIYA